MDGHDISRQSLGVLPPNAAEGAMPKTLFATFLNLVEEVFRPALTRPGYANLLVVLIGWLLCSGPAHTLTEALVASGVAGTFHHAAFHRFFSRGAWDPDRVGYCLLSYILKKLGDKPLCVVIDDTLAVKKGPQIFGLGTHVDAVRSTKRWRVLAFGHCWVVLSVVLWFPFSSRPWALPILFRLYRNKPACSEQDSSYQKKTELAREMLMTLVQWTGPRRVEVAIDSAFCNATVLRDLPTHLVIFGTMRVDAVLTEAPEPPLAGRQGRRAKRGQKLPSPQHIAEDEQTPWKRCKVYLYQRVQTIRYKSLNAQWYRVCGERLLRIVIVQTTTGKTPFRVYFSTDPSVDVRAILEGYGSRWSMEVFFRDVKQWLGFADSPARTESAVLRMAPFVGMLYSVMVLWFAEGAHQSPLAAPPVRPWYPHKKGMSFADIFRAAQRMLMPVDVLALARDYGKLRSHCANAKTPEKSHIQLAA